MTVRTVITTAATGTGTATIAIGTTKIAITDRA
jgi:hypothetical protein